MFERFFNSQNPLWQVMNTVFDLFVLNTLWLICCIPVVTIGPATTAAYYALIQRARGEQLEIHKDFFRSFKQNLKQGMLIGVILTLIGAFLAVDIYMCRVSGKGVFTFFLFFFGVIFLFWAMTTLYTFPILAKFERKTKEIFIWAFTLSIKNIFNTLLMLFVIVTGLWLCKILPGLIFIMFGLVTQYCATVFAGIFKPWLPKPWYLEEENENDAHNDHTGGDNTYADFDEAAFYGYDPEEVEKLMHEDDSDE